MYKVPVFILHIATNGRVITTITILNNWAIKVSCVKFSTSYFQFRREGLYLLNICENIEACLVYVGVILDIRI